MATGGGMNPSELVQCDPEVSEPERTCRICLESSHKLEIDELEWVRPCLCSGSMEYCHQYCMDEWALYVHDYDLGWLTIQSLGKIFGLEQFRCPICNYVYKPTVGGWRHPLQTIDILIKSSLLEDDCDCALTHFVLSVETIAFYIRLIFEPRYLSLLVQYVSLHLYIMSCIFDRLFILWAPESLLYGLVSWTDFLVLIYVLYKDPLCTFFVLMVIFTPFLYIFLQLYVFRHTWDVTHKIQFLDVRK